MADRKPLKFILDDLVYFQHQVDGIRQMARMSGALLADEMGLGKTVQALTVAAIAFEEGDTTKFLVVSPASIKQNWGDEQEDYTRFSYWVLPSRFAAKKREQMIADFAESDVSCLVVNYEQVVAHVEALNAVGFGMVIYDEAHLMKGRKSKRTKACFKLRAPRHFLLTGSPLLNQVDDLWALLHRIDPNEWPSYWTFVNRYAVYGGYMDKQIVGIKNEAELRERLQRYMIRREKKDCLDLPAKQFIPVRLDLHPEQKKLYDQAVEEMKIDTPTGTPFEISNALTKMTRLKQVCGTTATIEGHEDHSTKLDRAVEMIEEIIANGEPVVVFTQFRKVQECLVRRLTEAGIDSRQLHGDIKVEDRQPIVRAWTEDAKRGVPQALVCMYQVAGVGLTMTAASKCILLDKLYVPKLNEQAVDRLHRIGQTETVQVFEFSLRGTIEQRIERIIKQKNTIFGAVVDVDNSDWKKRLVEAVMEDEGDEE